MTIYEELLKTAKLADLTEPMPPPAQEQDHLKWLAKMVSTVNAPEFDAMPMPAQNWFDDACDALNQLLTTGEAAPIPAPAGFGEPVKPVVQLMGRPRPVTPPASPPVQAAPPPVQAVPPVQAAPPVQEVPPVQAETAPPPSSNGSNGAQQHAPAEAAPTVPGRRRRRSAAEIAADKDKPKQKRQPQQPEIRSMTQRVRELVVRNHKTTLEELVGQLRRENLAVPDERKPSVATMRYDVLRILDLAKENGWQPPA